MKEGQCKKTGLTLIESVVYISLLSLLVAMTVASIMRINTSLQEVVLGRIVDDSAQEVMEKLVREIRFATSVNTAESVLSVNPSTLVLNSTDISSNAVKVEFSVNAGELEFLRDDVLVGPLTPAAVTISELFFDRILTDHSEAVKISLVLQASRGGATVAETFSTTVVLRGSY